MSTDVLSVETRREVFDLIVKYPGLHLREVERQLNMSSALAEYHLTYLEKSELIFSVREEGFKRYYPSKEFAKGKPPLTAEERRILGILRQKVPLRVVLYLLEHGGAQHGEIVNDLRMSKPAVTYYLKKLMKRDIVQKRSRGPERGFYIKDKRTLVKLLISYKPTPDIFQQYEDLWDDLYNL